MIFNIFSSRFVAMVVLGIVSTIIASAGSNDAIFYFHGKGVKFTNVPEKKLMISASCISRQADFSCLAFQATKTALLEKSESVPMALMNPGSVICRNSGGKTATGVDAQGNENSFCKFNDETMIDNGSLYYYAKKNSDAKRQK